MKDDLSTIVDTMLININTKNMVTLHPIKPLKDITKDSPVMPRHKLVVTKSSRHFKKGQTHTVFIAKFLGGAYGVMTTSFSGKSVYECFPDDKALDETFEEIKD